MTYETDDLFFTQILQLSIKKKHLEGKFGVGRCVDLLNRCPDSRCCGIVELEESSSDQVTLLNRA